MVVRIAPKQSLHDGAVYAALDIYQRSNKTVWINPDGEKNKSWAGYFIDVIVADTPQADKAWVIEIETDDSTSDSEAKNQWVEYAKAYEKWHLAVPKGSEAVASQLLSKYRITNCYLLTWVRNTNGTYTFWGLPGLR